MNKQELALFENLQKFLIDVKDELKRIADCLDNISEQLSEMQIK